MLFTTTLNIVICVLFCSYKSSSLDSFDFGVRKHSWCTGMSPSFVMFKAKEGTVGSESFRRERILCWSFTQAAQCSNTEWTLMRVDWNYLWHTMTINYPLIARLKRESCCCLLLYAILGHMTSCKVLSLSPQWKLAADSLNFLWDE